MNAMAPVHRFSGHRWRGDDPLTDIGLCAWIAQALPGEILEYHRGLIAIDRNAEISTLGVDESERIDSAVLDINLHGEMVFEVARALKARGVPFVFATGYAANVVPHALSDAPRWEKPFDAGDLARWIVNDLAAA